MVIDSSIAMSWCFPDERTPESRRIFRSLSKESALAPAHFYLEVASVLLIAEGRARISRSQSDQFIRLLSGLPIEVDGATNVFEHVVPLGRIHGQTSYDAAYLELAVRRREPLATLDNDLRNAALALGVKVLGA